MNWSHVSTRTLIVVGVFMVCVSIAGAAAGFYIFHHYTIRFITLQGVNLSVVGILFWSWWTLDALRCASSQKALSKGDPITAEKHLGRVWILRKKAEAIRRAHGLVQPYSDRTRPLSLDSRKRL